MAALPDYVGVKWLGLGETPAPIVSRTEMDKGIAKQRRIASDVVMRVSVNLHFRTATDSSNFEDWFYSEINGGADWFDWKNVRTGQIVSARIVDGDIGTLRPGSNSWMFAERSAVFEYIYEAYP